MTIALLNANALHIPLADESVQMCMTSPPYWALRDYGIAGQLGNEATPEEYVANMVAVFREVRRVLKPDGVLWLNLGDSYAGSGGAGGDYNEGGLKAGQPRFDGTAKKARTSFRRDRAACQNGRTKAVPGLKPKDLCMIPARVAMALRADGWWLRWDGIWSKPNCMPLNPRDRPERTHEYLFLLSKSGQYFYQQDHDGFDKRSVLELATSKYPGAHFATFPPALVEPCVLAGSRPGDIVIDPFAGTATVGLVSVKFQRRFVGLELNPAYIALAKERLDGVQIQFAV